jgi:hypothetical protein
MRRAGCSAAPLVASAFPAPTPSAGCGTRRGGATRLAAQSSDLTALPLGWSPLSTKPLCGGCSLDACAGQEPCRRAGGRPPRCLVAGGTKVGRATLRAQSAAPALHLFGKRRQELVLPLKLLVLLDLRAQTLMFDRCAARRALDAQRRPTDRTPARPALPAAPRCLGARFALPTSQAPIPTPITLTVENCSRGTLFKGWRIVD